MEYYLLTLMISSFTWASFDTISYRYNKEWQYTIKFLAGAITFILGLFGFFWLLAETYKPV